MIMTEAGSPRRQLVAEPAGNDEGHGRVAVVEEAVDLVHPLDPGR